MGEKEFLIRISKRLVKTIILAKCLRIVNIWTVMDFNRHEIGLTEMMILGFKSAKHIMSKMIKKVLELFIK